MIKIGILGDIGSGKSYVAGKFGYPVFNADYEVAKLYQQNKKIFNQLKKRKNFNQKLLKKFKNIQYPLKYKKKKSDFIIKNDFTKKSVNDGIKKILKTII